LQGRSPDPPQCWQVSLAMSRLLPTQRGHQSLAHSRESHCEVEHGVSLRLAQPLMRSRIAIRHDKPPAVRLQPRFGIFLRRRQVQLPDDAPGGQPMHDLGAAPEATIRSQPSATRYVRRRLDIRDTWIVQHVLVEEQPNELENQIGAAFGAPHPGEGRRLAGHRISADCEEDLAIHVANVADSHHWAPRIERASKQAVSHTRPGNVGSSASPTDQSIRSAHLSRHCPVAVLVTLPRRRYAVLSYVSTFSRWHHDPGRMSQSAASRPPGLTRTPATIVG